MVATGTTRIMYDLYDEEEINNSLSDKAAALEDLLAGLSIPDDPKPSSGARPEVLGIGAEDSTKESNVEEAAISEAKSDDNAATKSAQPTRISPGSRIHQTICSAVDATIYWSNMSKVKLATFIKEAQHDPEHPISVMCKNIQSIVTLLDAPGDQVLSPLHTTFGWVEASLPKLQDHLADMEEFDDGDEWLRENAIKPARQIQEWLTKQKEEFRVADGQKRVEDIDEEDRVVIDSSRSESEDDSEEDEVGMRSRVILVPKGRLRKRGKA